MRNGRRIAQTPELARIRTDCARELRALPPVLRELREAQQTVLHPVGISAGLSELVARMDAAGD
jgi:hypothetical protein